MGGRLLARAPPPALGLFFPGLFTGGLAALPRARPCGVRQRAAVQRRGSARCLLYSASRAKLGLVAVVRAERVCIYDGFQLCVGWGFPVRRRGVFCAGGLRGVACGSSSVLFRAFGCYFFLVFGNSDSEFEAEEI